MRWSVVCFKSFLVLMFPMAMAFADDPSLPPSAVFPAPSLSTNSSGQPVYQFSMKPVVTNLVASSNELVRLQSRLATLDAEWKANVQNGKEARNALRNDYCEMVGLKTNIVAKDESVRKLQDRITALEKELKDLRAEFQQKIEAEASFTQLKKKIDAGRVDFENVQKKVETLRNDRAQLAPQVWQLQTLVDQARKAEEAVQAAQGKGSKAKAASP